MQEKIEKLKETSILEISNWWGLHNPGKSGTIISQDKKIYHYTIYYRETPFLKEHNIPLESLSKGRKITEKEYNKIIEFIEKNIIDKEFTSNSIFDAGWNVKGHYNNHEFNIPNNIGFNNEKGLYDITKELLDTIKGED
ncbi:MAG: hypothetical protein ACI4XM_00780 [Candidatus Coprovivens sp.]